MKYVLSASVMTFMLASCSEKIEEENVNKPSSPAPVPNVNIVNQNNIEQTKPQKPKKQKQIFDASKSDLIEYDDEKVMNNTVPLPGM